MITLLWNRCFHSLYGSLLEEFMSIYTKCIIKSEICTDCFPSVSGWFHKLLKSRGSLSTREQEAKVTKNPLTSVSSSSTSFESSLCSSSSSPGTTPSKPPHPALSSPLRWSRQYDVLVCHSLEPSDTDQAVRLVSFLEASPRCLRCFLLHRDICPGGAFSTELCQAVQNSHLRALLITPNFLLDDWCTYVMHQALSEGPMSNRMIPMVYNLSHSQYPQELKFYIYIDLSKNCDRGYTLVNTTVLKCE